MGKIQTTNLNTKDGGLVKKYAEIRFILRGRWNSFDIRGILLRNQRRNLLVKFRTWKFKKEKFKKEKNSTQKIQIEDETWWIQRKITIFKY